MTVMRTLLLVPGGSRRMIEQALDFDPDAIVFDLGAPDPAAEQVSAHALVREAIPRFVLAGRRVWIRVSATYTGMAKADVRAVVLPGVEGIILPKADSAEIVRYADALLRDAEALATVEQGTIRIIAAIGSAQGLLRAEAIARSSARLAGLAFDAEDYAADMRIERTPIAEELLYPRSAIAVVARATDLMAIDTPFPYLHDVDGLRRDAAIAKHLGFEGKLLIDPDQIEPVSGVFSPNEG